MDRTTKILRPEDLRDFWACFLAPGPLPLGMFSNPWLLNRLGALASAHAQWVADVHAIVLSLVTLVWTWPWVARMVRRMPVKTEIEWVRQWKCPNCETLNRQTYPTCSHCEFHLKLGFWRRRMPVLLSAKAAESIERLGSQYAALGWM